MSSVFEVSIWTPFPRSRLRAVALVGELEVSIVDAVLVDGLLAAGTLLRVSEGRQSGKY